MKPAQPLAYKDYCLISSLSRHLAACDVLASSVVPVSLIHPSAPAVVLGPLLDGLTVEDIAAAMAWADVTPSLIQDELDAGVEICDAVALVVNVIRAQCPELVDAVFVRFTAQGQRYDGGYTGLVFAPSLTVAMVGMLGMAKSVERQQAAAA